MKEVKQHISDSRIDYSKSELDEKIIDKDPIAEFARWMKEVIDKKLPEPNVMVLSTVSEERKPSSRVLLLRGFDENGFVFFTNYHSKKGKDIDRNPNASMNFFWHDAEKQVRVEGVLEKISAEESDAYFKSRPRESQLGAWTSQQSESVGSRAELEKKYKETEEKFKGVDVPRPPHWGGYLLKPDVIEFWQGRPSRLHDRIQYTLKNEKWVIERLAP